MQSMPLWIVEQTQGYFVEQLEKSPKFKKIQSSFVSHVWLEDDFHFFLIVFS